MSDVYDEEFCYYYKHQYYVPQGGICKRCDRCPIGFGLSTYKERKFNIDPIHGALGCQHCVRCTDGFFSDAFSYEECQPCLDCQKEGRFSIRKCSSSQDAVCGTFLPLKTNNFTIFKSPESNDQQSDSHSLLAVVLVLSCFVLGMCVAVVLYSCLKKRRSRKKKELEEKTIVNKGNKDIEKALLSTNSLSTTTNSTDIESCDIAIDSPETDDPTTVVQQWKLTHDSQEELSHRHARMICKHLITKNIFHDIGLEFGVPEIDIQIILADNQGVEEQSYATLKKWKELKASDATVFKLLDVLIHLGLFDIAKTFCEKYDTDSQR